MDWGQVTQGLYVGTAIFGAGVTAIDLLGLLGSSEDSDGGHVDGGHIDGGHVDGGHIDGGHIDGGHAGGGHAGGGDAGGGEWGSGEAFGGASAGDAGEGAEPGELVSADDHHDGQGWVGDEDVDGRPHSVPQTSAGAFGSHAFASSLLILSFLRRAVYFSLGFGPAGLAAMATGSSPLMSLAWSVPTGLASCIGAGWVFAFQRRDVDSSVNDRDLFFQRARVVIPISSGGMGKVRVMLGQSVVERYACAQDGQQAFPKDAEVYIVRITSNCVYVEPLALDVQPGA